MEAGQSDGGGSSIEIPTSQVIQVSVRLTETKQPSSQRFKSWSQTIIVKSSVDCLAPRKASINSGDNLCIRTKRNHARRQTTVFERQTITSHPSSNNLRNTENTFYTVFERTLEVCGDKGSRGY